MQNPHGSLHLLTTYVQDASAEAAWWLETPLCEQIPKEGQLGATQLGQKIHLDLLDSVGVPSSTRRNYLIKSLVKSKKLIQLILTNSHSLCMTACNHHKFQAAPVDGIRIVVRYCRWWAKGVIGEFIKPVSSETRPSAAASSPAWWQHRGGGWCALSGIHQQVRACGPSLSGRARQT